MSHGDFEIRITPDKENRTLTISDNGIGMTKEELEANLGTIAKSGSLAFKQENADAKDIDVIGHFGRVDVEFPWERTDKVEELKAAIR